MSPFELTSLYQWQLNEINLTSSLLHFGGEYGRRSEVHKPLYRYVAELHRIQERVLGYSKSTRYVVHLKQLPCVKTKGQQLEPGPPGQLAGSGRIGSECETE